MYQKKWYIFFSHVAKNLFLVHDTHNKSRNLKDYQIQLTFSDGKTGIVDLKDELSGTIFEPLNELENFKRFSLNPDINTISWYNRADFTPEFLYEKCFGDYSSPAWHGDVLRESEERIARGEDSFIDWEDAKAELRRLHT